MAKPTPDQIARARQLYRDGVPVDKILLETGLSTNALYRAVDGDPGAEPGSDRQPLQRRCVKPHRSRHTPLSRLALVSRLWRSAEHQVRDVEERLSRRQQEPNERERDARVLAVMVKTLRELATLDAQARAAEAAEVQADNAESDDDPVPRDMDELRRELARRIDLLRAGAAAAPDRGTEPD